MRIVDYTSIALKDLRGQPVRSVLTLFALIISTVILVIMAAISIGGKQAIVEQFGSDASLQAITVTPNQSSNTLSPYGTVQEVNKNATTLDDTTVAQLAKLSHVASATPRAHIWEFNNFTIAGNDKRFIAQASAVASDANLPLIAGKPFATNDEKNVAIIGRSYADELGFGDKPEAMIGKTIEVTTQKGYRGIEAAIPDARATAADNEAFGQAETKISATIIGVIDHGPDQNGLFVPLGWAHAIRTVRYNGPAGLKQIDQIAESGYSSVQLRVDATEHVESVSMAIQAMGYSPISTLAQVERLQQFSATMWVILGAVAIIAVVAAALGVVNTMLMAVSEQRYMIGVWRACGARKGFIVRVFLVEAGLLGLIGGLIGVGIGVFVSGYVNEYVGSLLLSQSLAVTNIAIVPAWLMIATVLLTTGFGILAGLYPAYRATRQDPAHILR